MTEVKAVLNIPLWVREIDVCCPRGHRSASKPTEDHTRDQDSLLFHCQEAQTMLPHRSERAETLEKPRRNHQKDRHNRNCCNCGPYGSRPQGSTPATGVNPTKTSARNNRGRNQQARRKDRNMSRTTCYNCNKKVHFANQCFKSRKPKN